jgi:hypothetical protein
VANESLLESYSHVDILLQEHASFNGLIVSRKFGAFVDRLTINVATMVPKAHWESVGNHQHRDGPHVSR